MLMQNSKSSLPGLMYMCNCLCRILTFAWKSADSLCEFMNISIVNTHSHVIRVKKSDWLKIM